MCEEECYEHKRRDRDLHGCADDDNKLDRDIHSCSHDKKCEEECHDYESTSLNQFVCQI